MPASCASVTSLSARRIAALTRCQAWPTRQFDSMPQLLCWPLHSVIANGPFERIEDLRRGDLRGRLRQLIAAVAAAGRSHQAAALQRLQHLADRRQRNAGALGHLGGGQLPIRLRRQMGQDDCAVVGQFADASMVSKMLGSGHEYGTSLVPMQTRTAILNCPVRVRMRGA